MCYQKVRLDKLNFSSIPVRLRRSETAMEQLKKSIKAIDCPDNPPDCQGVLSPKTEQRDKVEISLSEKKRGMT